MAGTVPQRLSVSEGRRFAFALGGAFLVLAVVLWWRSRAWLSTSFLPPATLPLAALCFAALLLAAGALVPAELGPIHRAWMGLGHALSRITNPILMAVIYFLVITPIGLVMRAMGRNPLSRPAVDGSFWVVRTEAEQRTDIERQF